MWQSSSTAPRRISQTAPKPSLSQPTLKTDSIKDHNGDDVQIAWMYRDDHEHYTNKFPPFPWQVYVLKSAKETCQDSNFPSAFVTWMEEIGAIRKSVDQHPHFQIYSGGFNNILACTDHQRTEVQYRNRNALWPRLVTSWPGDESDADFNGFILVIDSGDWRSKGLTLVSFDRHPDDTNYTGDVQDVMDGDEDSLLAYKVSDQTTLAERLWSKWEVAGNTWRQDDLDRYNGGGFSPALYPAVDPSSHLDVEHEEPLDWQDDDDFVPGHGGEEDVGSDRPPRRPRRFRTRDLWKRSENFPDFRSEMYEGHAGWETTSVWNGTLSKARPPFAFTLYLAADLPPFTAEALFSCLDRGHLQKASWTLDVVRNVPDMQSALHHYSHEARHRTLEETRRRGTCIQMLLGKICGSTLPEELLQLIADKLDPPAIPDYAYPPGRTFHDMFLFLNGAAQLTGPQIVYFNHYEDVAVDSTAKDSEIEDSTTARTWKLRIINLHFWRLVSEELLTVWSLCIPRLELQPGKTPILSLRLELPHGPINQHQWHSQAIAVRPAWVCAFLKLHSDSPITIHCLPMVSPKLWAEFFEIEDVKTGEVIPFDPPQQVSMPPRWCAWEEDDSYEVEHSQRPVLQTIQPGQEIVVRSELEVMKPHDTPPEVLLHASAMKRGRQYRVRAKRELVVPRWTYGARGGLKGPFNLPPLPVTLEEEEIEFTYYCAPYSEERDEADD